MFDTYVLMKNRKIYNLYKIVKLTNINKFIIPLNQNLAVPSKLCVLKKSETYK